MAHIDHIALEEVLGVILAEPAPQPSGDAAPESGAVQDELDLYRISERGLPKRAVTNLMKHIGFSLHQMAELLPISERTLQRYGSNKLLDQSVTEHLLDVAMVVTRGTEVFGSKSKFLSWLESPVMALENRTPMELLDSRFGVKLVLDELGRIEHGIVA